MGMTEQGWLNSSDPEPMLRFLAGKASVRKGRLLACAFCRVIWGLASDWGGDAAQTRNRVAIDALERHADGLIGDDELHQAILPAADPKHPTPGCGWLMADLAGVSQLSQMFPGRPVWDTVEPVDPFVRGEEERACGCDLIRDIFGNPCRTFTVEPAWLTWQGGVATRLAAAAYQERHLPTGLVDTLRVAVLADALEEAGCTNADMLGHLRGPGTHVLGCWVVDALLGKN
jgi:hypothetical protein